MQQHALHENSHLVGARRVTRIEERMESYLHLARRMMASQFGPEAGGPDNVLATVTLAGAMASLETAEIIACSQDHIADTIEDKEI